MSDVDFTPSGPPETILPDPDPDLTAAVGDVPDLQTAATLAAAHPSQPLAWAALADAARRAGGDDISVYAYYRVGYHRGLDLLRKSGWRGSGYVRRHHQSNQGFLRCLEGLGEMAEAIGEVDEAQRCREFLQQLDPEYR
jgi:hypothetical protein